MVNFVTKQYVKNIWYNILTVIIITFNIILCVIFASNISSQTKLYRLVKPYLNENSLIINTIYEEKKIDINNLKKVEKTLMTTELFCHSQELVKLRNCVVYNEKIMEEFAPRLSSGKLINSKFESDEKLQVLISENSEGLGVGDILKLKFTDKTMNYVPIEAEIVGVISNGQKLFMSSNNVFNNMGYEDLYLTYSYNQLEEPIILSTQKEIDAIGKELDGFNGQCIVKFDEDISEEEYRENYLHVVDMESKTGIASVDMYPSSEALTERMELSLKSTLMKYVPLTVAVFILVIICVVGIIAVKTSNSIKYYGMLYICGMPYHQAAAMTGIEMIINSVLAIVMSLSLIKIQNKLSLIGKINCEIGVVQSALMMGLCIVVIFVLILMTTVIMKEKTASQILRDTAY